MTVRPLKILSLAAKIGLVLALVYAGSLASEWLTARFVPHLTPSTEPAVHRMIMIAIAAYAVCMLLPFVPGMEIGLGLMIVFGPPIVPLVYGATLVALSGSFLLGRLVPEQTVISALGAIRLTRTAQLLTDMQSLPVNDRLPWLLRRSPGWIGPQLLRYRYLALAVLFNLPGNAVMGGGGGIAMMAGFSRLFGFPGFVVASALAVAPVPLLIALTGSLPTFLAE